MGGAARLLAEVLVFEGMDMRDVLMHARNKVVVHVSGVGIAMLEGPESEGGRRDWEDGEERVHACQQ